jgi:hypothetical protein
MSRAAQLTRTTTKPQTGGQTEGSGMKRSVATLGVVTAMLVGLMASPALAQYVEEPPTVVITTPGATIEITGRNWPEAEIEIIYTPPAQSGNQNASIVLGTATVADDGTFSATVDRPADLPADATTVPLTISTAEDSPEPVTQTHVVSLTGEPASAFVPDSTTENQGMSTIQIALAAVILLAGLAVAIIWRRRATSS